MYAKSNLIRTEHYLTFDFETRNIIHPTSSQHVCMQIIFVNVGHYSIVLTSCSTKIYWRSMLVDNQKNTIFFSYFKTFWRNNRYRKIFSKNDPRIGRVRSLTTIVLKKGIYIVFLYVCATIGRIDGFTDFKERIPYIMNGTYRSEVLNQWGMDPLKSVEGYLGGGGPNRALHFFFRRTRRQF